MAEEKDVAVAVWSLRKRRMWRWRSGVDGNDI
jgi:hypothetical protein